MLIALFAVVSGFAGTAILTALGGERPVGYRTVHVSGADGKALPVSVWYPTEARPRPTTLLGLVARLQLAVLPQQTDTPEAEVIDADEFRAAVREAWTSQPLDERRQALGEIICRADGCHSHDP